MPTRNLVIVEDSTLKSFMRDPRFLELLPCLNGPKKKIESIKPGKKNCDKCKKEKRRLTNEAMRVARDCVRNARGERLAALKRLMNTNQIRITSKNSRGAIVKYTL